jgi:hypothetical protein
MSALLRQVRFASDSVAKAFLRYGSQILRGVGAAIEQRCGGPRRPTPNSQAILAAGLRLYRAAIIACFVLWREFSSCGFWDFCNTILHQADIAGLRWHFRSSDVEHAIRVVGHFCLRRTIWLEPARRRRIFRKWRQSSNAIAVLSTNALKQSSWYRTPVTHPVKSAGLR